MAFPTGNTGVANYPQPFGTRYIHHFDHTGPASYTRLTAGAVPVGGDLINAADLGFGGFDNADATLDTTGQLYAVAIMLNGGSGNAIPSIILKWFSAVTATVGGQSQTLGTEVAAGTNLSTFSLRVQAFMG